MSGRLTPGILALVGAALFTLLITSGSLQAQEVSSRFRVLVPNLEPQQGADDDFGKDVAEELRDLINDLPTHAPVDEDEVEDALDRFKIDEDDLDCVKARQLAGQIDAQLVMCGSYLPENNGLRVTAAFVNVSDGSAFDVPEVSVAERDHEGAAQHILQAFETFVEQTRFAQFCGDYAQSQQWQNAIENCDRAIELNPQAIGVRYTRGMALMELEQLEDALAEFKRVLELSPIHENALQAAGYVSAQLGQEEDARRYYSNYLELNPANAAVRMRVAYDLAQAGDPMGAAQLIEEGLEIDPENILLCEQLGNFAFSAAGKELEKLGGQSSEVPPEVADIFRKAIDAYNRVFEAKGAEANVSQIRNVVAAQLRLGDTEAAIAVAEQALETHPEEAVLWSVYADALEDGGRLQDAIAALERIKEIDPEYANLAARQGNWLLDAGQRREALPYLRAAVERGEQSADAISSLVFADAYRRGVQGNNLGYAISGFEIAKQFQIGANLRAQCDFWHGYALYKRAEAAQEPQTLQTAQETLPQFRQALGLLQASRSYADRQPQINLQQFLSAVNTYIEIQEAIIRRGR
jgi:tetratricopeptide (TPR) repeat protein